MKVLVTGGTGYVGSRVVARLLSQGHEVRVLDQMVYGGETAVALSLFPGFELQVGDIRESSALDRAMDGVDGVIHLAAIVGEGACNVNPELARDINFSAIPTILDALRRAGSPRLIIVSTCSNYGVTDPNTVVDESGALKPLSEYARAKVVAEEAALNDAGAGSVTVLRLGTICGLAPRMRFDLLVNEMARDTVLDRELEIYTPQAWRPFLHIDDAAEAMEAVLLADLDKVGRQVFNVVGENHQKTSLLEIARRRAPDLKAKIVDRAPDLRDYRVSGERIGQAIGYQPSRTVEQAFNEVADAVRDGLIRNPDWPGYSATPLDDFQTLTGHKAQQ